MVGNSNRDSAFSGKRRVAHTVEQGYSAFGMFCRIGSAGPRGFQHADEELRGALLTHGRTAGGRPWGARKHRAHGVDRGGELVESVWGGDWALEGCGEA